MTVKLAAVAAALVASVTGFVGHQLNQHPGVQKALVEREIEATHYLRNYGFSCGVEAWAVKTMADSQAAQVNLAPGLTTIHALDGLPVTGTGQRLPQTFLLNGTRLVAYKLEADSDIHLVLRSPLTGETMIGEIPDPQCAAGSVALAQIAQSRAAFVAQVGQPQTSYVRTNIPIRVTGVGFYDFKHGQTGVAVNGIELHPVLSFRRMIR